MDESNRKMNRFQFNLCYTVITLNIKDTSCARNTEHTY